MTTFSSSKKRQSKQSYATGIVLALVGLAFYNNNRYPRIVLNTSSEHLLTNDDELQPWWTENIKSTPIEIDDNKMFVFPPGVRKVWIDVGVHKGTEFMHFLEEQQDLFVLGFEPSQLWKPCEHKRCAVFKAACTPSPEMVKLNLQNAGGLCNSLFKPNTNTTTKLWRGCVTQQKDEFGNDKVENVQGVPLHSLVSKIPPSIEVEYIKIDAQGYDLQVMKGALQSSSRISVVSLEAMDVTDRSQLLYHGQPTLDDIKDYLKTQSWDYATVLNNDRGSAEVNAFFIHDAKNMEKAEKMKAVFKWTLSQEDRG